jgi:GNAT superfamily N-acetyltransferase
MKNDLLIRTGRQEDIAEALELVKELAVFERAPDAVEVSIEEMSRAGFGEEKIFDFFVAELEGKVVGIALYYFKYSTWKGRCLYLDDLIVTESYRGKGIGEKLLNAVLDAGRKAQVRRVEWQVLNWNHPAIAFYKKIGAELDDEWVNCRYYFNDKPD